MHHIEDEQLRRIIKEILQEELKPLNEKLDPMYEIFVISKGWSRVTKAIFKTIVLVGAGIAVIYGFLRWIKQ